MSTVKGSKAGKPVVSRGKLSELLVEEPRDQLLCPGVTINELLDDVLLEIFGFYLDHQHGNEDAWHVLVHVCRRWRCIVFASPRRLRLRLVLTNGSRVKEALEFWPRLPIAIRARCYWEWQYQQHMAILVNSVILALEQHDRVCEIDLFGYGRPLLKILSAMEKPFPSLVNLTILLTPGDEVMIPDSFLGGYAPCLRSLQLFGSVCGAIEKLLLSARNLVVAYLSRIPRSGRGYSSPEAMVNGLSVSTRLKSLHLRFDRGTPQSQPHQASGHPPPFPRVVLPALSDLNFYGDSKYLEDILSRIDTPLLANIHITFIGLSVSDTVTPTLRDFISRTEAFGACSKIHPLHSGVSVMVEFIRRDGEGV